MTLPEIAIRRPVATSMLLLSLLVVGVIALLRLPLAFLPEFDEPRMWIVVEYPNATPATVERMILRPMEEALGSMAGLNHMWSTCDDEGARVLLNLRWGTNMGMARVEARERVERIRGELPSGVERIHISEEWDPGESGEKIMEARISSGRDLSRDYDLLDRKIIRPLRRVPGVAQVRLSGVNPREVRINLRLDALERHRVDVRDVHEALLASNEDRSLGVIRSDQQRKTLRASGAFHVIEQIRELVVSPSGLRLADVADVSYEEPELEYGRHLDSKFAVGVSIAKESSANTVAVSDGLRERVELIGQDPELEGIKFLVWEDQGKEIKKTIGDLRNTGLVGALLASIVLFLFLRRFSTTLVAVSSIPFSLVVACGVVWAEGKTMNTLTLLGLIVGVGMLVDNAVVVMENIERYRERGYDRRLSALLGSREVSTAVIAATATSVIVFLPMIFSRPSELNIMLRELGLTVCYTLLASLFISQTLIPLMAGRVLSARARPPGRVMEWVKERYGRLLGFTLHHRWLAPTVGLGMIASAIIPFQKIDKNFDTNKQEMFVTIRYIFEGNPSLDRKEQLVTDVEQRLEPFREELEVDSVYSFWSDGFTMTRVYLEEGKATEMAMGRVRARLREVVPKIAGVRLEVLDNQPFWQRNRGKRIGFQLRGQDSETLARIAEDARARLEKVPGLLDVYSTAESGREELHATIDRERAQAYGVPVEQPADVVELTFRGRRLPRFKGPDGEVEMRLLLEEDSVKSVAALEDMRLLRGDGTGVPLASVAAFERKRGPERIDRANRVTNVWVGGRYEDGVKEEMQAAAKAAVEPLTLPFGYEWDFQASRRDEGESQAEFLTNLGLALMLIFAVMAGLFESMKQALSLLVSLPFAMVGAVWALYLTGTDFDQPASVGLLLLLGIVVNNGIVMIEHINQYRRQGLDREQAMLRGGTERLRPIVMTAVTTLLGLVPIVIDKPNLAGIYYYSMALVIMGGLLLSTVLTTVLLPTTVCIIEDFPGWLGRLPGRLFRGVASLFARRAPAS